MNTQELKEEIEKRFDKKFGSIHPDRAMPSGLLTAGRIKAFILTEVIPLVLEALRREAIELRMKSYNLEKHSGATYRAGINQLLDQIDEWEEEFKAKDL